MKLPVHISWDQRCTYELLTTSRHWNPEYSLVAWNKSASWNLLAGIAALLAWPAHVEPAANNPYYTAASIVNAATNQSGHYAPNSIITIYGTGLSFDTMAVDDAGYLQNGALPLEMAGVHVIIDGLSAGALLRLADTDQRAGTERSAPRCFATGGGAQRFGRAEGAVTFR